MDGERHKNFVALRRRPFYSPVWLAALGGLAGIGSLVMLGVALWLWSTANATTVIVVRQAEQESGAGMDPPLSAAAQARAQALAQLFGEPPGVGGLDAIFTAPTASARATVAPLAARLGLEPIIEPGLDAPGVDARAIARAALRDYDGGRVLIVARADAIPQLVASLHGHGAAPALADGDHGAIYIVTVPRLGRANLLQLRY